MALPVRAYRKDIALMVAFNPAQPSQFTTFCGADKGLSGGDGAVQRAANVSERMAWTGPWTLVHLVKWHDCRQ